MSQKNQDRLLDGQMWIEDSSCGVPQVRGLSLDSVKNSLSYPLRELFGPNRSTRLCIEVLYGFKREAFHRELFGRPVTGRRMRAMGMRIPSRLLAVSSPTHRPAARP